MKWYCVLLTCAAFHISKAQTAKQFSPSSYITPYRLEVTCNKTTNLVFPANILTVDRGSQDVIVQKATEAVLRVKADQKNFEETNLSVITEDGKLYSFLVTYVDKPTYLNINVSKEAEKTIQAKTAVDTIEGYASQLLAQNEPTAIKTVHKDKMLLSVTGIYVKDNIIFCRLSIGNNGNINYEPDQLRFFVRDARKAKRTSEQEIEIEPLFTTPCSDPIEAGSVKEILVALPKFTLSRGRRFVVSVSEKNGGRNLGLKLGSNQILNAKPI